MRNAYVLFLVVLVGGTALSQSGCGDEGNADQRPAHGLATRIGDARVAGFVGGPPGYRGGRFVEPVAVGVHDAGDRGAIYVAETSNRNSRVQRLDADGNFVLAWGRDAIRVGARGDTGTGFEVCRRAASCKAAPAGARRGELDRPSALAVSPATGDVYVLDSGNARVQRFASNGTPVDQWALDPGAGLRRFASSAIATAPSAPHDVFVADPTANRILQFGARGRFLRAWGVGVATGGDELETCTGLARCHAGRPPSRLRRAQPSRWPGEIAVDRDGTVYGSVYVGNDFAGSDDIRTRILRFAADPPPDETSADERWLEPLRPANPNRMPRFPARHVTNGTTLGLAFDTGAQRLIAMTNPFGTSKLDAVAEPGADAPGPRVAVLDALPFLQNVHGVAVGQHSETLYLASGSVRQRFGTSTYTGCADEDAKRDCHGLIVLGPRGSARAVLGPALDPSDPPTGAAFVDARGSARYRFEASRDGRRWRPVGGSRQVTGGSYEPVTVPSARFARGAYALRLVVERRTERGEERSVSNRHTFVAGM